jgi:two-component system nitrogen regulation response regulator GlnG
MAEDDEAMRRVLVRVLARENYLVTALSDGRELLDAFERLLMEGALPQLIISDIRMPGVTGFDFLERLEAMGVAVPVILISAFCDEPTLRRAAELGATCVLSKPFDMDVLRSAALCVLAGTTASTAND